MNTPKSPYQEVTDPANERILGTLTPRAWARWSVVAARARFFGNDIGAGVLQEALQSSGAIRGEHRKDLVEAIQGAKPAPMNLTMGAPPQDEKRRL